MKKNPEHKGKYENKAGKNRKPESASKDADRVFLFSHVTMKGPEMLWERRLGFVGIIIENRLKSAETVNKVLSEFGELIIARTGIPYQKRNCCVITLVVDATTDEVGTMTGKLGMIDGVTVKSALSKGAK